jgi:hypothetical protein
MGFFVVGEGLFRAFEEMSACAGEVQLSGRVNKVDDARNKLSWQT